MRQTVLLGIILLIFGFVLLYSSSVSFENQAANNSLQSTVVYPHNTISIPFDVLNSTILGMFYYSNSSAITYYFMNQSAFSTVIPYLNSTSLLNQSEKLKGHGLYQLLYNTSSGVFPYQNSTAPRPPSYYYNGTSLFNSGTYYIMFHNSGNTTVLLYYSIVKKLQISINNALLGSSILALVAVLMLLAGVGLLGYSLIVKKEAPAAPTTPADIDQLYAKYSDKPTHALHAPKRRKKPGK